MSEQRDSEQAGAPVAETEVSATEVQAAVERAHDGVIAEPAAGAGAGTGAAAGVGVGVGAGGDTAAAETSVLPTDQRPPIAIADELPSAGPTPTAVGAPTVPFGAAPAPQAPAAPYPTTPAPAAAPGAGDIRISADHPMAAFYTQSPLPPEPRGNRLAGVLISLLATVGFAIVYSAVLALLLAPELPPSRYMNGLIDVLLAWSTILAVVAFAVGMVVVVLVVGRAGWWAYVLGGFLVAVFVWAANVLGHIIDLAGFTGITEFNLAVAFDIALFPAAIAALLVAREVTVWFGAWIGSRGRRISRANAEALAEYERSLTEPQANQS